MEEKEASHWFTKETVLPIWPSAVCESGTIPFNTTRSCFVLEQELLLREGKGTVLTVQHVCHGSSDCWLTVSTELVFMSGARKTYSLMPTYLQGDTPLGSPLHRLQWSTDLFPRKDCLHEILLGMIAVSHACLGQDGSRLTSKAPPRQAATDWALSSAGPKKTFQQQGDRDLPGGCIWESEGWFQVTMCCLETGLGTALLFCWRSRKQHDFTPNGWLWCVLELKPK